VWVEDERTTFEHAWESNPMTSGTPMAFPTDLGEVEELAKWVKKTICAHQATTIDMTIDLDFIHLFVPPSFTMLRYNKLKAYGNHFQIDNDYNNLLITYDYGVASIL
jgi:hypothetical protein